MRFDRRFGLPLGAGVLAMAIVPATMAGWTPAACAQRASAPTLHRRADPAAPGAGYSLDRDPAENGAGTEAARAVRQPSSLPNDASGAYRLDEDGGSVEIDIVHGKLTGYISRLGDDETDSGTPLTYFFDKTSIDGDRIAFQTRVVHGVWYSFRGAVLRGSGKTRADEGYYVLHGVLREHHPERGGQKSADETIVTRSVNLKSMARQTPRRDPSGCPRCAAFSAAHLGSYLRFSSPI